MVGVAVVDALGHVLSWNAAAERLTGWSASAILGAPFPLASPSGHDPDFDAFHAGLVAADLEGFSIPLRDNQGGARTFHAVASPIADTDRYTVLLSTSAESPLPSEQNPHPV